LHLPIARSDWTSASNEPRIHRIEAANGMERALRYDHYKVLGVQRDASTTEIKRAYRERVKQWHPDLNASARSSEVFQALHEAYLTLKDHASRSAYDQELSHYRAAQAASPPTARPTPSRNRETVDSKPPTIAQRAAYKGLHLTGLLFGCLMILGIAAGCLWRSWPPYMLIFALPGLAVLPDSIEGLRHRRPH